jgi:hypothetical protein
MAELVATVGAVGMAGGGETDPMVPEGEGAAVGVAASFNAVPKLVAEAEFPLVTGLFVLRRAAGGTYAARAAILNAGMT